VGDAINKCAKFFTGEIKSIGDVFPARRCRVSRVSLYDLIAAHGKTSERIGETKRSGEMRTGTGKGAMRRAGWGWGEERVDVAVGGERAEG